MPNLSYNQQLRERFRQADREDAGLDPRRSDRRSDYVVQLRERFRQADREDAGLFAANLADTD